MGQESKWELGGMSSSEGRDSDPGQESRGGAETQGGSPERQSPEAPPTGHSGSSSTRACPHPAAPLRPLYPPGLWQFSALSPPGFLLPGPDSGVSPQPCHWEGPQAPITPRIFLTTCRSVLERSLQKQLRRRRPREGTEELKASHELGPADHCIPRPGEEEGAEPPMTQTHTNAQRPRG